jgi:diacylglycerol kinase family enzyme
MNRRIDIIYNSQAGTALTEEEITASFKRHSDVTLEIHIPEKASNLVSIAEKAIESGADVIVAAGGDGTTSAVASALVKKDVPLGLLPMGTLNHLAKDLGVPMELDGAVDVICTGNVAKIDVGEINDKYFVNNVSMGFYPKIVRLRERWRPYIGKWAALVPAVILVLLRLPFFRATLNWNGGSTRIFAPLIFIGNNPYETTWPDTGKRSCLNTGVLWIVFLKSHRLWDNFKAILAALRGNHATAPELEVMELKELSVRSFRRKLVVGIDGELVRHRSPLKLRIHPESLKVMVPRQE